MQSIIKACIAYHAEMRYNRDIPENDGVGYDARRCADNL
jgi:hypothetical protein